MRLLTCLEYEQKLRRNSGILISSSSLNNDKLVKSPKPVTLVKAGVHNQLKILDCGLRRNDDYDKKSVF